MYACMCVCECVCVCTMWPKPLHAKDGVVNIIVYRTICLFATGSFVRPKMQMSVEEKDYRKPILCFVLLEQVSNRHIVH